MRFSEYAVPSMEVIVIAAKELGLKVLELSSAEWKHCRRVPGNPRQYIVTGPKFRVIVHENKAAAEEAYRLLIQDWLVGGVFFDQMTATSELYDAVAERCQLSDMKSWFMVKARENWGVNEPNEPTVTIDEIKTNRFELAEQRMKDIKKSLHYLLKGDYAAMTRTLLEQCAYSTKEMLDAILLAYGGWEKFTRNGVVAITNEGILIEADDDDTADLMLSIYTAAKAGE